MTLQSASLPGVERSMSFSVMATTDVSPDDIARIALLDDLGGEDRLGAAHPEDAGHTG